MENLIPLSLFSGSVWQIIGETSTFGLFILGVLVFMSLVSWVIIFNKWRQFKTVESANDQFMHHFSHTRLLNESSGKAKSLKESPLARIFTSGYDELADVNELKNQGGVLQDKTKSLQSDDFEIIEMTMEKTLTEEMGVLESKVTFLAATASSAPFTGLLGTVVGIMDSFWAIGERGSASLAVVAPGIAEALLATIVGLGAAIPAVIAYNWANNKLKKLNDKGNNFILQFTAKAKKENL